MSELRSQGFDGEPLLRYAINMRYLGQNYETEVEVPPLGELEQSSAQEQLETAYRAFNDRHESMYDYVIKDAVIEMISFRVTAIGSIPHPDLATVTVDEPDRGRFRSVYYSEHGPVSTELIRRSAMPIDELIQGPVIIEEPGFHNSHRTGHDASAVPTTTFFWWR